MKSLGILKRSKLFCITVSIQLFVLALIMTVIAVKAAYMCGGVEVYTPHISQWESRILTYENGWSITEKQFAESGYQSDEIVYGPYIALPKGDYTVRIEYECDSNQAFRLYAMDQEDRILPQSKEVLPSGKRHAKVHFIISEPVDNFEVRICYDGHGNLSVYDISVAEGWWEWFYSLVEFLAAFILTDFLLAICIINSGRPRFVILAVISAITISINPNYVPDTLPYSWIRGMFINGGFTVIVTAILFYYYYKTIYEKQAMVESLRGKVISALLSGVFSAFLVFGYSYKNAPDSWELVFNHHMQSVKAYAALVGLTVIIYHFVTVLLFCTDKKACISSTPFRHNNILGKYMSHVKKHPFIWTFITLFVFHLPYLVLCYPGIFHGDSWAIILQAFQIPNASSEGIILLSKEQYITQHHPVLYTLFLHLMILVGINTVNSANVGLAIVVLVQAVVTFAAVSCLVKTECENKTPDLGILITILYFIVNPKVSNYIVLLSKEALYSAMILFSIALSWRIMAGRERNVGLFIAYISSITLVSLLRNEGFFLMIIQLSVMLIIEMSHRKLWTVSLVSILTVHFVLTGVVYPFFSITPTTEKEALSVPIQQTARYLRDYPEDVTEDEIQIINKVWDYNELMENGYDPNISDQTKGTFRFGTGKKNILMYLGVWAKMLPSHPDAYIQATLNNYYEYFYPGATPAEIIRCHKEDFLLDSVNSTFEEYGLGDTVYLSRPKSTESIREVFDDVRDTVFSLPVISLFNNTAFYIWLVLFVLAFAIYRRDKTEFIIVLPLLLTILVCILGPCNGSTYRYAHPITVCLPASLLLLCQRERD